MHANLPEQILVAVKIEEDVPNNNLKVQVVGAEDFPVPADFRMDFNVIKVDFPFFLFILALILSTRVESSLPHISQIVIAKGSVCFMSVLEISLSYWWGHHTV